MSTVERYVAACRAVLRCTQAVAQAADRDRWEAVLAAVMARQHAADELDRLPAPSAGELGALREQALPLLQEAAELNRRVLQRARRLHDLLRPVVGCSEPRFLDVRR